jgi:hypothetical protein
VQPASEFIEAVTAEESRRGNISASQTETPPRDGSGGAVETSFDGEDRDAVAKKLLRDEAGLSDACGADRDNLQGGAKLLL